MLSKGVLLLFLISVVFFIIYISSSDQTLILPGSSGQPAGISIFAPMPGVPPLQSLMPVRENFTVKFGKTNVVSPAGTVSHLGMRRDYAPEPTECPAPPPPPPQNVESVDISYRHGVRVDRESAESVVQVVNLANARAAAAEPAGVRISSFNPLMII